MADAITYRIGALFNSKGNLGAKVVQNSKAVSDLGARLTGASSNAERLGASLVSSAGGAALAWGKAGAAIGAAAAGAGVAALANVGFKGNVGLEKMQNTVAGTLQLFGHSAGAADRLGQTVKVAAAAMMQIQDIADKAPGELQDIQMLFQNMLPGARAATGSMKRILDLTKNVALFTPTIAEGDFKTAGAQVSRMLSGGAGSEMSTWRNLSPLIMQAGLQMDRLSGGGKIFAKSLNGANPEKITTAFNQLQKEDRFALLEKVLSSGGDELANMYAKSWEGASANAKSGMRKVAMSFTNPLFNATKDALVKAGDKGGIFSKERIAPMQGRAEQIGKLMAVPLVNAMGHLERGAMYFQDNFNAVFNRMYHAFQIGGAVIKGAFAFGVAKMIAGAALMAAGGAVRGGVGVARGVGKAYGSSKNAIGGVKNAAKHVGNFMDVFTKGSGPSRALGVFTMMGTALGGIATVGFTLIPMLVVAGIAMGVLSLGLLAVAGIAAYLASRWQELSASVVKGFQDGSITLRPLVIASLILWERLKAIGEAFIGGATGANMMQSAIGMATSVVNGLASSVSILAEIAAMFLRTVAMGAKSVSWLDKVNGYVSGETPGAAVNQFFKGGAVDGAMKLRRTAGEGGGKDWSDRAMDLADRLSAAGKKAAAFDLKDLKPGEIEDWTKKADQMAKDLFAGDTTSKKGPKKAGVNIHNFNANIDLRNTDPDRMMVGLMEPARRMARMPDSSPFDRGGF